MFYSKSYEMCLRPTSCFIRNFPSSVSSAVGWAGYTDCTESIIISSSTGADVKQNNETLTRKNPNSTSTDPYFLCDPYHPSPLYLLLVHVLFWKYNSQLREKENEKYYRQINTQAVVCYILKIPQLNFTFLSFICFHHQLDNK